MARLVYSVIASLDGYVADENGDFDWATPDEDVHAFVNDLERPLGTYLYGRRMYETMVVWEHPETFPDLSPALEDYARIWQAADKVVYSTTLPAIASAKTRLERSFDPDAVREMKATATRDLSVGGPGLAAEAIEAGLVDEYQLLLVPVVVGGRHPGPPRRRAYVARTGGRAPFRERHDVPVVPDAPLVAQLLGLSAKPNTSRTSSAMWKVICSRTCSGTSSRSPSLRFGRTTSLRPARWAASTFCLSPPIGSTRPCSVTSPVIPTTGRTGVSVSSETSAVVIVTPALGPSFGNGARRHVDVEASLEPFGGDAQLVRVRPHVAERDLRGLLHHVAELTGEREPLGVRRPRGWPR